LWQYRSGKEVCYQEDTTPGGSEAEAEKEKAGGLRWPVKAALARVWEIFDYPCGQRLKPILELGADRLRQFGELRVSEEVIFKLKRMSSATIDRKLRHQGEVLQLLRSRGGPKPGSLLKGKIPIKLTQWDNSQLGYVEADLVVHCGSSALGSISIQ